MKIFGKTIKGPNKEYIHIPRGENPEDCITFHAQAVLSMEDFYALCPEPKPPKIRKKDNTITTDTDDPGYKAALADFYLKRQNYMILKSLECTPGLEWETVDMKNPNTWSSYHKELTDSGFTEFEINKIIAGVWSANGLNEERLEACRKHFLAMQQEASGT